MKKQIVVAIALSASMLSFAQKDELKSAEKALKKGDYEAASTALNSATPLISNADAKYQAQYYYLKGKIMFDKASQTKDVSKIDDIIAAFDKVIAIEAEEGKEKYTDDVKQLKSTGSTLVLEVANKSYEANDYKNAALGFEKVYRLSPTDTIMLSNAAVMAVQGKDYPEAIRFYEELNEIGYDGSTIQYMATEKESGEQQSFPDKATRDLYVRGGSHNNPEDVKQPSKKAEILKNLAFLYVDQNQTDKAFKVFKDARAANPNDVSLVFSEANLYLKTGDNEKFEALMKQAASMEPNNPDVYYNIGVVTLNNEKYEEAREAFKKTLSLKPDYTAAAMNLSTSYINEGNALLDEMNKLGNSQADIEKYNALGEKKNGFFKTSAEVLEDYLKANPDDNNTDVLSQLKNIYGALGDTENFTRVKGLLGE